MNSGKENLMPLIKKGFKTQIFYSGIIVMLTIFKISHLIQYLHIIHQNRFEGILTIISTAMRMKELHLFMKRVIERCRIVLKQ